MSNQDIRRVSLVRKALTANALFSAVSALACLLAADALAVLIGAVSAGELRLLGFDLLAFAAFVGFLASRPDMKRTWIRRSVLAVIALDVLWVVGSALVLLGPMDLTSAGRWLVFAVALVVADFAAVQVYGLLGLRRSTARRTPATAASGLDQAGLPG